MATKWALPAGALLVATIFALVAVQNRNHAGLPDLVSIKTAKNDTLVSSCFGTCCNVLRHPAVLAADGGSFGRRDEDKYASWPYACVCWKTHAMPTVP
jgi:hypothetical protein